MYPMCLLLCHLLYGVFQTNIWYKKTDWHHWEYSMNPIDFEGLRVQQVGHLKKVHAFEESPPFP